MTEENKESLENLDIEEEEEIVEPEVGKENAPDPTEVAAREKGWRPKEEFAGDPEDWVDAKEFVSREPLYKALHKANREIKRVKREQDTFKQLYDKLENTAKEKAIAELREQLRVAAEEKDIEAALSIKDKITELEVKSEESAVKNEEFETWLESNDWYESDEDLRDFADGMGFALVKKNKDMPLEQIYEKVTKAAKEAFPNKFGNPNKTKPNAVDSGKHIPAKSVTKKKEVSYEDLPEEVQDVYRKMVKKDTTHTKGNVNGILSHAEFIRDYIAVGGTVNTGA